MLVRCSFFGRDGYGTLTPMLMMMKMKMKMKMEMEMGMESH